MLRKIIFFSLLIILSVMLLSPSSFAKKRYRSCGRWTKKSCSMRKCLKRGQRSKKCVSSHRNMFGFVCKTGRVSCDWCKRKFNECKKRVDWKRDKRGRDKKISNATCKVVLTVTVTKKGKRYITNKNKNISRSCRMRGANFLSYAQKPFRRGGFTVIK